MTFISQTPFKPHPYEEIEDVYPPGAMPPMAYAQYIKKFKAVSGITTSRIEYESDGLQVNGLMCAPQELQPKAHPILLFNRGGFRHYGMLTVHSVMQNLIPYAAQGYICVAPNYRGNDGGEGADEFAGRDVQEVLNLLKLIKSHEAWDGQNSFMVGHSRGGMMTLNALASGAEVNAAVSIAGLTDLTLGGKESWRGFLKYLPKEEQRAPKAMLEKRSAVFWADTLNTPLLLLHGDADTVVPAEHSISLANKLEALGKPHELKIYPGGNHALIRDWKDVIQKISDWMARHAA